MRIFPYFNLTLLFLSIASLFSIYFIRFQAKSVVTEELIVVRNDLPRNPFTQKEEIEVHGNSLALDWKEPKILLPDLQNDIKFLGRNLRPDVEMGKSRFYITIGKKQAPKLVKSSEKVFLTYLSGNYSFSDEPTDLWLDMTPLSSDSSGAEYLEVRLFLKDENQEVITEPYQHHIFTLKADDKKGHASTFEFEGFRADASLLLRQGARLSGIDLFLQMHGGDEFKEMASRERIDFLAGETPYSAYVKEGDFLIWKENKWHNITPSENSEEYPLLVVKKVDDKGMNLEIWDVEGKLKVPLSLLRTKHFEPPIDLSTEFKLVGAKTWVECIVECHSKRLLLKEGDWIVLTADGWKKISCEQDVDDFVNQVLSGPLFVLDKIGKKNNRTTLMGHVFNGLRTSVSDVEITSSQESPFKMDLE